MRLAGVTSWLAVVVVVSCLVPRASADGGCPKVSACAAGTPPTFDSSGCPSCALPDGRSRDCTVAQLAACAAGVPTLRTCGPNEEPKRGTDCCMTCKPDICSAAALDTCRTNYKSATFTVCAAGTKPTWQPSPTCCYDCRPPVDDSTKPKNNVCTDAQRQTCIDTVQPCVGDAKPTFDPTTSCCPSCIRPEDRCTKDQVVTCAKTARTCDVATNEKPVYIANECCPSCKPADPVCTPACDATTQKCVRTSKDSTVGACVNKDALRRLTITLKASAAQAIFLKGLTCADLPALLSEIIQRYCSQSVVADTCKSVGNIIAAMIVNKCTKDDSGNGSATVDIDLPPGSAVSSSSNGISLFAAGNTNDAVTVINQAMADQAATNGYSVTTSASSASRAQLTVLLAGLLSLVAVAAAKLL